MRIISVISFLLISVFGQAQEIVWSPDMDEMEIAEFIGVMEDPDGSLTIKDIVKGGDQYQFEPRGTPILNLGFTESVFWFQFDLQKTTDDPMILEFASPHLEDIRLYKINDGSVEWEKVSGYHIPIQDKLLKNHFQLFDIHDREGSYVVRISPPTHPIPVRVYAENDYEIKSMRQKLVFGFVIGFMFFVILSNLFFFYSLKNQLFLFYSGMAILYLSYAAFVMDGFIVYFVNGMDIKFWFIQIPSLGVILHILYSVAFMELKKYAPKVYKVMMIITAWFIFYFLAKFFIPRYIIYAVNTINALISFFAMFYIGYITGKRGNRLGYYFAATYLIYFLLVLTEATYVQLGVPGYLAELSHVTWATLIEAFILSYLLSKRFEWEKVEVEMAKNEAQQLLLEKTQENERIIREQNVMLESRVEERTEELRQSLEDLKATQSKLIQSEKLASLGELTAGIAHEIQNPLNFVNNFSDLNVELVGELKEYLEKGDTEEVNAILGDLQQNSEKINHHGKRADGIVKSMLEHSRASSGQSEKVNVNKLCDELTKLAYHGFRAKDKSFTGNYKLNLEENLPLVELVSQEMGRVILNLVGNALYIVNKKYHELEGEEQLKYQPLVEVSTDSDEDSIHILVKDNGSGIPEDIQEKIFQPFFTTKPTGEGTGLGLSLVYDIVKSSGGHISFNTSSEGTTFKIELPVN